MAAGDSTQGRRVPGDVHAYELSRLEYGRRGPMWYGVTPNDLLCTLTKHAITEHDDGTITVSPSIAVDDNTKHWHGFLQRGNWIEA